MMDFGQWCKSVEAFLASRKRGVAVQDLDPAELGEAFNRGESPLAFATRPNLPMRKPTVPPIPPWITARRRQAPEVLSDPKYLVDTGLNIGCPACGSANLVDQGKAKGTGLMYFGSIAWVLTAAVIDSAIASKLSGHRVQCSYCGNSFTL